MTITEAEILEALALVGNAPDDARTVQEMVAATGYDERKIRRALQVFHAAGRLTAHRVHRAAIDGRNSVVAAYTIAPAPAQNAAPKRAAR